MEKKINVLELLAWVDLEMTGLSVDVDYILEAAIILTNGDLEIIAQGPHMVVHQPAKVLDSMDAWCKKHHGESGLTKAVLESSFSVEDLDKALAAFMENYCGKRGALLAGNSIWQDRLFIQKYLPRFSEYLHYKMVDVTSVQQLVKRWYKNDPQIEFKKKENHRAMDDIEESIAELRYYRKTFWKN